jgi:hypothetical protein
MESAFKTLEDYSCDQCQALMLNGIYCHETGCPNTHKVKIEGEWTTPESDHAEWCECENCVFYEETDEQEG